VTIFVSCQDYFKWLHFPLRTRATNELITLEKETSCKQTRQANDRNTVGGPSTRHCPDTCKHCWNHWRMPLMVSVLWCRHCSVECFRSVARRRPYGADGWHSQSTNWKRSGDDYCYYWYTSSLKRYLLLLLMLLFRGLSVCLSRSCIVVIDTVSFAHGSPMSLRDRVKIWLTSVNPFLPNFCPKVTHPDENANSLLTECIGWVYLRLEKKIRTFLIHIS